MWYTAAVSNAKCENSTKGLIKLFRQALKALISSCERRFTLFTPTNSQSKSGIPNLLAKNRHQSLTPFNVWVSINRIRFNMNWVAFRKEEINKVVQSDIIFKSFI